MMDKVASSPALATAEGWPVEETPALSENEVAALGVALGVGMSVIANTEETPERHTVADLASLDHASALNLASVSQSTEDVVLGSSSRLQTLPETSEGSQEDAGSAAAEGEEDSSQASGNKVASFYIGDEHGCTRDLPPAGVPDPSLRPPLPPRRVQIQELEAKKTTVEFTPPDGGYGWVVALAACVVNFWIVGFIKSYGVLYVHVRNAFPDASAYHASWLPALLSTIGLIIAPVTGVLCRRFTSRKVSFVGGIFSFLGLALGSLAMSMNQLIIATGILTGLGAGLTTTPGVLIVSLYFEKRRALASAICVSGNALGGFFLPPLVDHLLSTYGLRGTMLILAAMQLHICAASMLYRPIRSTPLIQAVRAARAARATREEEAAADLPEHKLLPNTPATPRPPSAPAAASAPNTPLSRPHAIWQKMVRRRLTSVSVTVEDEELKGQVSFLRSSSMMNSIPDLTQYARSWSISVDRASLGSRSSSIRLALDSKSSLSRLSLGGFSKSSLNKLTCGELRHPPLMRLASDSEERAVRHPTLLRLASEEDSRLFGSRTHGGSARRLSHPRPVQASSEGRVQRQSSCRSLEGRVQRQPSCRRVQSRIMDAVKEQDTDSQGSDELEECLQKLSEQEQERVASKGDDEPLPATKAPSVEVLPIVELSPRKVPTADLPAKGEAAAPDAEKQHEGEKEDNLEDEQLVVMVKRPNCCCSCLSSCLDLSLFTNPLFLMMAISVFFMASGAPHAIFFLPAYANSIDIPSSKVPHMLSISSMVDLCGRLGIGFISDIGIFRISHLYFISALAAGIATLLVPQMTSFASLSVALGIYGYGIGAWFVLIPTLLAKHHGAARLASSYGLVRLFHGFMNFISPQISGLMIDTTGDFGSCYYFMGTFMALSASLLLLEPALLQYSAKKSKEKQAQEQALKTQV
nr:uncharacterized protein LOC113820306 [Penaeus vannamei]